MRRMRTGQSSQNRRLLSGTVRTKVRVGRKPNEKVKRQQKRDKEARIGRSRTFLFGTSGPKVRRGREPADSTETGDFHLRQFGTSGTKVRVGREKPKRPKANKKSQ
ncbi:hypothetical protein KI387_014363, partial [Taxus chinensis]